MNKRNKESGSLLMMAIILLVVGGLVIASLQKTGTSQVDQSLSTVMHKTALYDAEGTINWAIGEFCALPAEDRTCSEPDEDNDDVVDCEVVNDAIEKSKGKGKGGKGGKGKKDKDAEDEVDEEDGDDGDAEDAEDEEDDVKGKGKGKGGDKGKGGGGSKSCKKVTTASGTEVGITYDPPEDKTIICHKPGTPAEKTLEIPNTALKGHLKHGDTEGKCTVDDEPNIVCGMIYLGNDDLDLVQIWSNGVIFGARGAVTNSAGSQVSIRKIYKAYDGTLCDVANPESALINWEEEYEDPGS